MATADTFKLALDQKVIGDKYTIANGQYILGVYLIDILREIFHTTKHNQILVPLLFDFRTGEFINDQGLCDHIFAKVQECATMYRGSVIDSEASLLQLLFTEQITEVQDQFKEDYSIRAESSKMVLKKRTQAM